MAEQRRRGGVWYNYNETFDECWRCVFWCKSLKAASFDVLVRILI